MLIGGAAQLCRRGTGRRTVNIDSEQPNASLQYKQFEELQIADFGCRRTLPHGRRFDRARSYRVPLLLLVLATLISIILTALLGPYRFRFHHDPNQPQLGNTLGNNLA